MWPASKLATHTLALLGWLLLIPAVSALIWTILLKLYPVTEPALTTSPNTRATAWPVALNQHWQKTSQTTPLVSRVTTSRLAVQVQGLWLSDNSKNSVVLLKYRNKNLTLSIGDELEQGVVLIEIRKDKLVFKQQGQFEKIPVRLFDAPAAGAKKILNSASEQQVSANNKIRKISTPSPVTQKTAVDTQALVDVLGPDFRQSLTQNPLQLLRYLALTPQTHNGELQGFLLQPTGDSALFTSFNLQHNDLLVAVDGIAVSDTPAMLQLQSRLQTAHTLDFDLIRNNQRIQIRLEME